MGFDQLSPVAPTRVRCLLLPCGRITLATFSEAVIRLQKENHVRLSDVSPEHGSKKAMFSPASYPMGSVFLDYSTSDAPESSKRLAPFELYRRPLIVLGIADGGHAEQPKGDEPRSQIADSSYHGEALEQMRESHGTALIYKIMVFNSPQENKTSGDILHIPAKNKTPSSMLKTTVCDIVADFLEELSFYARSIQALPNIDTPTTQPIPTYHNDKIDSIGRSMSPLSGSDTSSPTTIARDSARSPYRASMPAHVLSPLSAEIPNGHSSSSSPIDGSRPATNFDDMDTARPSSSSSSRHNRQVSVSGFGSGTNSEKARNQAKGRIGIVVGSMYLLAGRWSEAIRELAESAITAKWSNDHAWFAKALDNILIGLLMCGWAGIEVEIPQICYPGEKPPWSFRSTKHLEGNRVAALRVLSQLLPDLTNQVLYYYGRAVSSSYTEKAAVPMLTFSESALRFARLLSILRFHYGALNELSFQSIINNSSPSGLEIPETIDSLATNAEIASIALRAAPAHGGEEMLGPLDRLNILAGIASILSSLGYHRKKAFILREFMTILLPLLIQSRKDNAAEMGYHPAASLSSSELAAELLNMPAIAQNLGGAQGDIVAFLDSICEIYGVVSSKDYSTTRHDRETGAKEIPLDLQLEDILSQAKRRGYGNTALKMDVLRWCINICEALPYLPGMLRYSSGLMTTASTGQAPGPDSHDAYPIMLVDDQIRSVNTIARAAAASKQLGLLDQEAEYWDDFLVRDIEIVASSTTSPPIPRRKHDLDAVAGVDPEKKVGPFIYNPFATKPTTAANEPTLLLDGETTFIILLQNLFDVELDIEWLKLETDTNSIDATARGITVGPYRTQKIYLKGRPKVLGFSKIVGCTAKVRGCKPKTFPIFKAPWRPNDEQKLKKLGVEAGVSSRERPLSSNGDVEKDLSTKNIRPQAMTYPFNIIEDQPLVILKSTSLTQSAIMVLVGQTRRFHITLENTSTKEIDFLLVTFTDSTSDILRAAVENKETSLSDVYEAEYSTYHQPAFKLAETSAKELSIEPKGRLVVEIEVFGKPGLHNGTVQVSYSHLGLPRDQIADKFYIRQITVPVVVTVNASVDLIRTELLPYSNVIASSRLSHSQPNTPGFVISPTTPTRRRLDDVLDELRRQHLGEDRCFLLLDFFNAWPRPLRISLEANESDDAEDWNKAYEVEDVLQPGNSARLLIIVPKVSITNSQAQIPTINPANRRQFVLSANKISVEIQRIEREMYWYREEVLKNLRATWSELGGLSGRINLRTMRISPRALDLLKPEVVEMTVSVAGENGNVEEVAASAYNLAVDAFITITVQIHNRGKLPIHPVLRIQPGLRGQPYNVGLDLSRKIAFNGLLQRVLPILEPNGKIEVDLGVVFLCTGEYEFSACLEELRPATPAVQTGQIEIEDRRLWYSKRPCLLDVWG